MRIAAHTRGGYGGVPQKVGLDYEKADERAGKFQGASAMKKVMGGKGEPEVGMSPRKAMGHGEGGNFGTKSFSETQGHMGTHPDAKAGTGAKGAMEDGDRAIGMPIHHTKDHHPSQAAPHHGPHHVAGYGNHHGRR